MKQCLPRINLDTGAQIMIDDMTNLTDFTTSQLDALLSAVTERTLALQSHNAHYERYELQDVVPFKKKYKTVEQEINDLTACLIPIMNARSIVSEYEAVNNN